MENFKGILIAVLVGIIAIVFYFKPIFFDDKNLQQHDLIQAAGANKEVSDFRARTGEEALWSNSMFAGMPSYITNTGFSGNWVQQINYKLFRFLPRNADVIFVNFICMFILLLVFRLNVWVSLLGGLLYAFATFTVLSTGAGHLFKILAIGYAPLVIAGIKLVFEKKWFLGLGVFALGTSLEFASRHYQITFYLIIVAAIYTISELVYLLKREGGKAMFMPVTILIVGAVLAIGPNIGDIWTTLEYSEVSIRGEKELTPVNKNDETVKSGLDKDYAFKWSQGKWESLTLFVPYIYGGASGQPQGKESAYYKGVKKLTRSAKKAKQYAAGSPLYWGPQAEDGTGGPYYVGILILFFAIYGCFALPAAQRNWLLFAIFATLIVGWGKNFSSVNYFLFDYVPGFNKFRAVAMALTITVMCVVVLGAQGLDQMIKNPIDAKWKYSLYTTLGIIVVIWGGTYILGFSSPLDVNYKEQPEVLNWIRADRKSLLNSSAIKSIVFVLIGAGLVWLIKKGTLSRVLGLGLIILVAMIDLMMIDATYLWHKSPKYIAQKKVSNHFKLSKADKKILEDESLSYRVLNLQNPFNNAEPSYYHKSIGGYSGVKMQRYQDLIERRLSGEMNSIVSSLQNQGRGLDQAFARANVLNMLNNKYVIYNPQADPLVSTSGYGNVWLVKDVKYVDGADQEIAALSTLNDAVAILDKTKFESDSEKYSAKGEVKLVSYEPNNLMYEFKSADAQLAVFSEVYYKKGWNAYIDGEKVDYIRANYILRALDVPAGQHSIQFKFEPKAYVQGNLIALISSIVLLLILCLGAFMVYRESK